VASGPAERFGSISPERSAPVNTTAAIVIIAAVTILGFYLLAGYIVYRTGATTVIANIGRAVADMVAAITQRL
jgi:hypothetical protein